MNATGVLGRPGQAVMRMSRDALLTTLCAKLASLGTGDRLSKSSRQINQLASRTEANCLGQRYHGRADQFDGKVVFRR